MMICYIDEVGMSSIAGPVLVCGVIIDAKKPIEGVKDSKKISKDKRNILYKELVKFPHAFGSASPKTIEKLNIFWARFLAMKRAINALQSNFKIDKIIVDGKFKIPDIEIPQEAIIKADEKLWQVGAASILAKVKRDTIMERLSEIKKYSYYGWETNAGYYTPKHRKGIISQGPTTLHRKNFEFYKYCIFCHKEFIKSNKTFKEYLEYEKNISQNNKKSFYMVWKSGILDSWREVKFGENCK